jgi:hypothetical protein
MFTIVHDQNYDHYIEENLWTEDNYDRINNRIITFTDETTRVLLEPSNTVARRSEFFLFFF